MTPSSGTPSPSSLRALVMSSLPWQEKLRVITSALLGTVADLHASRPSAALLAAAVADMLQLQESVNVSFESALGRERMWRKEAEKRIEELERRIETVSNPSPIPHHDEWDVRMKAMRISPTPRNKNQTTKEVAAREKTPSPRKHLHDARRSSAVREMRIAAEEAIPSEEEVTVRKSTPSSKKRPSSGMRLVMDSPQLKRRRSVNDAEDPIEESFRALPSPARNGPIAASVLRHIRPRKDSAAGDGCIVRESSEKEATVEGRPKRVRAEKSLPVTPPRRKLPRLPTLGDVERDWAARRAERREREEFRPPACAKCRLRKRAVMLRADGYIKEDVFERWASKPGGCIEYMHQDEEGPETKKKSSLTFEETETQSP